MTDTQGAGQAPPISKSKPVAPASAHLFNSSVDPTPGSPQSHFPPGNPQNFEIPGCGGARGQGVAHEVECKKKKPPATARAKGLQELAFVVQEQSVFAACCANRFSTAKAPPSSAVTPGFRAAARGGADRRLDKRLIGGARRTWQRSTRWPVGRHPPRPIARLPCLAPGPGSSGARSAFGPGGRSGFEGQGPGAPLVEGRPRAVGGIRLQGKPERHRQRFQNAGGSDPV